MARTEETETMNPDHIQRFAIGDIQVAKVIDTLESFSPKAIYVDKDRGAFDPHLDWLQPHFIDADKGMLLSIHTFVVKTRHHTVLIDTCVGNHKRDAGFPQWNDRNGNYLAELEAAGCALEDVDYVFCTHMHIDHTGWNTRLRDGRWVPTFPNAKYLFNRREWESWNEAGAADNRPVLEQNILPIIEAGQVEWVDNEWQMDDQLWLVPTPGHTPGHCSVALGSSHAEKAFITGDMMVHPVQIAEPHWRQRGDSDKQLAVATRSRFVEDYCDRDVLILGTHFNTPTGVYIVDRGGRRRVRF